MPKEQQTAHRLAFALHSSVSKPNQWKVFIKISIKPFGSWKNGGENRKEWKGRGRWMDGTEYFPYSSQKYTNFHSFYFLCIYAITVLPSLLPINILQWLNRNILYFKTWPTVIKPDHVRADRISTAQELSAWALVWEITFSLETSTEQLCASGWFCSWHFYPSWNEPISHAGGKGHRRCWIQFSPPFYGCKTGA